MIDRMMKETTCNVAKIVLDEKTIKLGGDDDLMTDEMNIW